MTAPSKLRIIFNLTVLVAALGYFVDMFDLLLFPIVRQPSLTALGVAPGDALPALDRAGRCPSPPVGVRTCRTVRGSPGPG